MKKARSLFLIAAGVMACMVAAFNAEATSARGPRVDPNAVDKIPSPFHGTVVNVTATTITVRGDVKTKTSQPANGEPRQAGSNKSRDASVTHTINFSIKPDVTIKRDGKPSQLKDIHKDDTVTVTFTSKEGSSVKHVIEVAVGALPPDENREKPKAEKKGKKKQ